MAQSPTLSELVGRRVRKYRDGRFSAQALADRCAELGVPRLDRSVIANMENGRRESVSIDEVAVLAAALDVPPCLLFLPIGDEDEVHVTPTVALPPDLALRWFDGSDPLVSGGAVVGDRRAWRASAAPVALYRELRRLLAALYDTVAELEAAEYVGDEALTKKARARHLEAMRPFVKVWREMGDAGLRRPGFDPVFAQTLVASGLLGEDEL
jgi:transcriptional regulator with XRE-family HTH domain